MNLIKVQQEVIKALCNGEKVRRMDLVDDNVLVTYNFITAYAIRRADLFLDLDKLLPWELKIPESHKQHEAEKTGVLVEAGGALLRKFKTSSGNAYAQEKELKHFDKYARFYFLDNAFYVYENGERFAGIVMAFKHEEDDYINELAAEVHENAKNHGWWDEERSFGELIALCHSELSEALEEYRNGHRPDETYYGNYGKPEGIPSELADVIIRILDMCGHYGIDIGAILSEKHEYNKTRPYKHGGKVI